MVEADISHYSVDLNIILQEHKRPEILAINPAGSVPFTWR
jgi:glutathione S-transferase